MEKVDNGRRRKHSLSAARGNKWKMKAGGNTLSAADSVEEHYVMGADRLSNNSLRSYPDLFEGA